MEPQEETFMPKVDVLADLFHAHVGEEQRSVYTPIRTALPSSSSTRWPSGSGRAARPW